MGVTSMTSKIEIERLTHRYERKGESVIAVADVSLSIEPGEFVSIVGPSGCGKTTLLFSIAGFIRPSQGRILLDGRPISSPGPDRGVVFQSFALFNWLTVRENIEFGLKTRGDPLDARRSRSSDLLAMVGLSRFADRYPYELSGGMKQRTAIARALATDPDLLLMDEPFGALDAQSRDMMQEELVKIWQLSGKTVLFITHSIDEAIFLSSRVIVFTSRPGSIKHILNVDLPKPRYDPHVRTSQDFIRLKDSILDMVRLETMKQFEAEEGLL
jgi:NitT/TauT family transport system ATP-binding protein